MSEDAFTTSAVLFSPRQLTLARHSKGLKKVDLARLLDVSAAAITQFENASARPSSAVMKRISLSLGFAPDFFRIGAADMDDDNSTDAFFRSLRSTTLLQRQQALANARLIYRLSQVLERHVELPAVDLPSPVEHSSAMTREDVETAANRLRATWSLPVGPVRNVVQLLEAHGVLVARTSFATARVDAFSKRFKTRPFIMLGDDKGDTARSRFDAAHELGHLLLHEDEEPGSATLERQAHQFAAAFLMPSSEIRAELPRRVDLRDYARLKQRWGASISALLYRARDLDVITPVSYQRAIAKMSALGWRVNEPAPLPTIEWPVLLPRAMRILEQDGYSVEQLENDALIPRDLLVRAVKDHGKTAISL